MMSLLTQPSVEVLFLEMETGEFQSCSYVFELLILMYDIS